MILQAFPGTLAWKVLSAFLIVGNNSKKYFYNMSSNFSGVFILIIGPSGVGKGTVINILRERHPEWIFPISATTRAPRPGETAGKTYHFLTGEEFKKRKKNGEFLESAWVHGKNQYGVLKSEVIPFLEQGKVILREVDVQGFLEIRKVIPAHHLLSLFLLPPSWELLSKRIRSRAPITEEELQRRFESMKKEMEIAPECDFEIQTEDGNPLFCTERIEEIVKNWFEKENAS